MKGLKRQLSGLKPKIINSIYTRYIIFCLSVIILFRPYRCLAEEQFSSSGPFKTYNHMPLYIFYMQMEPDSAAILEPKQFQLALSYRISNIILQQRPSVPVEIDEKNRIWWVYTDTEVNSLILNLAYGLLENCNMEIILPFYSFSSGFLDGFIENFEEDFDFNTPGAREARGRYNYEYNVRHNGNTLVDDTSKPSGIGEMSLLLKYLLFHEQNLLPAASLRGQIKLPTASDDLLGSEKIDYGFGILLDKSFLKRFFMYGNFNVIFINKPDIFEELDLDPMIFSAAIGLECVLTKKLAFITQAIWNTTPYESGILALETNPAILTAGFNYNFNDNFAFRFAFDENITSGAPDFGIHTNITYKF